MAVHVIDPSDPLPPVFGDFEHALILQEGDTVLLAEGATIAAYGFAGRGIHGWLNTILTINGRVSSQSHIGIFTHGVINIGHSGSVSGGYAGIYLPSDRSGNPNILMNAGSISTTSDGESYGVSLEVSGSAASVINTGTIIGRVGIHAHAAGTNMQGLSVTNTGLIKGTGIGGSGGIAIIGADLSANTIINRGEIGGAIILGMGNDLYDGRGGTVTGSIWLSGGNDTAFGGAGSEAFWLGEGINFVDGGDGIDTLHFHSPAYVELSITGEQQTSATSRDTIRNIENLVGSEGDDFFVGNRENNVLDGAGGNDWLDGGLGNDTLNGGNGMDVLVDDDGSNSLSGGAGDDYLQVRSSGSNTLDGGSGDDGLYSYGNGNDVLIGGAGQDTLHGGDGIDVAVFSGRFSDYVIDFTPDAGGFITIRDTRAAGDGIDLLRDLEYLQFTDRTIALTAPTNSAPTSVSLSATSVGGNAPVGTVIGTLSGVDPDGDPLGYHLVSNPGNHFRIHGNQLLVDRALTGETRFEIVVRASDPHGASIDRTFAIDVTAGLVAASTRSFSLKGGKAADVLTGGRGNDYLNGGLGNDKLTGGAGRDTFAFSTKLGPGNVDRIVDFNHADDTIRLSKAIFGKLQKGSLSKDAFWIGAKAHDKSDRIIFNEKTGALYYDADGSGTKYGAVKFAQLKAKTLLKADDFFVV